MLEHDPQKCVHFCDKIMLYSLGIDHVNEFGPTRPKLINVI